ncbi:hypothetical protein PCANC_19373 [Puccinia coronata f. sp. avenae]|uniref:Mediator of RNA polymerase II transcription subunit 12 n=1 Tax=Puccinia coronata f. sp. avenae TaxID=200324 RepID=A0A2N5UPH8_9BASI|nr:hypothetical protein PCANC_19373 [Puccinia coronata f. sp. avenae]
MAHNLIKPSRLSHAQPPENQNAQPSSDKSPSSLDVYQLQPPRWRLPTQLNRPDLGYPGLHPTHIGQHEDAITKSLVQWGFSAQMLVSTESFSAHQMIYKKITEETAFNVSSSALSALIEARRRYCAMNSHDTKSTIKVPGRVTLNEQKRENWLRELADDSVPLLKLSKNVPHGFKGEKLLEMLVSRKIECSRATWYIRLIGLNEINAQRNKNDLSHIRYTLSFTPEVCQFLQKQLAEVTVPLQMNLSSSTTSLITTSSRLAAMNVRSKPRSSTLSDPETRKHWVAKWTQSCMLLKRLIFESLLDQPSFFKWIIDQMKVANLAQIHFLLDIYHSVFERFNLSYNLVRGFVEACLFQIRFIAKQTATSYLSKLERRLKLAVQSAFTFCPDNFVWPDLWIPNKSLLQEIILADFLGDPDNSSLEQSSAPNQLREILTSDFYAVNWRVTELIGDVGIGTGIVGNIFTRRAQLVEILDSYSDYSDCSKLYYKYFLHPSVAGHISVSFKDKLEVLLSWATTLFRNSDKRVHLVASTLSYVKKDYKKNGDEFQNILVGWLEQIESTEGGDLLVRLFSELSRRNIFSYGAYVQRMVAKGDTECDILGGKASGVQALLSEWMPLASSRSSRERSNSIKRSPGRDFARNGLMAIIADFNSAIASADYGKFTSLLSRRLDARQPTSANRKLVAEILPKALVHLFSELAFVSVSGSPVSRTAHHPELASALLTWGFQLLESCQAYATLFEIMQRIVQIDLSRLEALRSDEGERTDLSLSFQSTFCYLQIICMSALNNKDIMEISGQLTDLVSRLFAIHFHFRRVVGGTSTAVRGFVRCLRNLVLESNDVDPQILEVLDKEYHPIFDEMTNGSMTGETLPSRTKEILQLLQCPSTEQVSLLVHKYWEAYRSDMDWGPALWNSLIAAIKIHSQEEFNELLVKNPDDSVQSPNDNMGEFREVLVQLCEDLDMLYEEGLIGCLIRAGYITYPHPDDEALFTRPAHASESKMTTEEEEGEENEGTSTAGQSLKDLFFHNPRSLCRNIRRLLLELMSSGLISIEVALEEYVIRPLADDVPQQLGSLYGDSSYDVTRVHQTIQVEEALRQVEEIHLLVNEVLCEPRVNRYSPGFSQSPDKESGVMMTPSRSRSDDHLSLMNQDTSDSSHRSKEVEYVIVDYVRTGRLDVERKLWFEQSEEGSAFCSRLLLSLLISMKTISELSFEPEVAENSAAQQPPPFEQLIPKILDAFESLREAVCQGSDLLRRQIPLQAAVFLDPILELVTKNDLGTIFHTKLIHSIDELLPYSQSSELVNHKYPYLESIFKESCIFNHAARTRQFQLHIRLLMSTNPPQMPMTKETPIDVASTLGALVEVMAKRLHLTDSKDAAPFFLDCLPLQVAEALIIKLSLYLGMSICKLLGPNSADSALEVLRIHHICRCITTLTNQLTIRTYQSSDDVASKVVGGCGPLGCNATIESYLSYWQQLKSGLTLLNSRLATSDPTTLSPRRMEYRIMRALLHSTQVVLWSLPGLTQQLGTLKQTIAEVWIEISLRVQGDSALQNQIMDTIGVLLFPTVPDDSCLTATVGILRKRFRWLYLPILNMDDGANLVPSNRLKYLLGCSLRGSSTIFQERPSDGAVKFLEEKPWEELEKMDVSGPGFISIDALKCQTLSHVEQIPEAKPSGSRQPKLKSGKSEGEDVLAEEIEPGGERGSDQPMGGLQHALNEDGGAEEEEEGPETGDRHSFEHELITDGLSTIPLHFLRSLYPPASRLLGTDWLVAVEQQKLEQAEQAEQTRSKQQQQQQQQQAANEGATEQNSGRLKKRKGVALSPSPAEQIGSSSSTGPTLRSARSTRKKSTAAAPANPPPTASSSKRVKKR